MKKTLKTRTSGGKTFKRYALEWLEEARLELSEASWAKYRNVVNLYLLPSLGEKRLKDFNRFNIGEFSSTLLTTGGAKRRGLQPSTVNTVLTVLKRILDYASQKTNCPTVSFRKMRVNVRKPTADVLRRSEQKRLWDFLTADCSPCSVGILLCLTYGLRIGEICGFRWGDINLEQGTLSIRRTLTRKQTFAKNGKKTTVSISPLKSAYSARKIPLSPNDVKLLSQRKLPDDAYVLTGNATSPMEPRTLSNSFKKTLRTCGVREVNFHTLRHSFATRWIEFENDVKALSEILGHSSVNVTMNYYVHPSMESKRRRVAHFSKRVFSDRKR